MVSILGANSVSGGYEVSNSLRFNDGDSSSLSRTLSGSGTQGTYTFSAWIKRSVIGGQYMYLFSHIASGDGNAYGLAFHTSNNTLYVYAGSGIDETAAQFRDPAAWYHIVLSVNSTSYTLYVNGTSIKTGTAQSIVYGKAFNVGNYGLSSGSFYFDGYMTEVHFIDGTAKAATDFGETNDNGVWIPKEYTGSYGTNGFFLQFKQTGTSQNSSGIGADTSGNDNHFAVTNLAATDVTTDTCTNNYATLNSILPLSSTATFSQGNLKFDGSAFRSPRATQGISNGKFYFEVLSSDPSSTDVHVGIATDTETGLDTWVGSTSAGYVYTGQSGQKYNNNSGSSYGATFTDGDIIGCAIDMDNGTLSFYKNNSSQGQAYSGLSGTVFPVISGTDIVVNFGQDSSFAGDKTAQGNSDANGYGDFYYSPPSGYYALNTKNLAEFG